MLSSGRSASLSAFWRRCAAAWCEDGCGPNDMPLFVVARALLLRVGSAELARDRGLRCYALHSVVSCFLGVAWRQRGAVRRRRAWTHRSCMTSASASSLTLQAASAATPTPLGCPAAFSRAVGRSRTTSTAATRATPEPPPGRSSIRAPTSAVETLADTSAAREPASECAARCAFRIGTSASPTSRPPMPETMRRIATGLPRPRATQTASRCRRPTAQTSARDLGGATCRRTLLRPTSGPRVASVTPATSGMTARSRSWWLSGPLTLRCPASNSRAMWLATALSSTPRASARPSGSATAARRALHMASHTHTSTHSHLLLSTHSLPISLHPTPPASSPMAHRPSRRGDRSR